MLDQEEFDDMEMVESFINDTKSINETAISQVCCLFVVVC